MTYTKVKIVTFAPIANADKIRQALGSSGAGQIGEYSFCSYSVVGKGRFIPSNNANPHIGEANVLESVTEERIEVTCDSSLAKNAIDIMKRAHPYEEVAFDIYLLVDASDL